MGVTEKSRRKKMDVVISTDTTGSMFPCLAQVRREVEQFINDMFNEFLELRIGIIAHGDYCDADNPYTIIYRELSRDSVGLCKFIRNVEKTYGGDADECYELVLNLAHSDKMGWREDADKILIMIGDAAPHGVYYPDNKDRLDWVNEAEELRKLGVKVFAVHALAGMRSSSRQFYKRVADTTMGVYLTLDQFNEIIDLIKATVCQQSGEEKLSEFITIIKDSGRMTYSMDRNIRRLKGEKVADDEGRYSCVRHSHGVTRTHTKDCEVRIKEMGGLVPVVPGRFQVMTVDENCDLKGFVNKNGIEFKKGRGFYELTKAETVQQYKEVIMQDRETGEMFNGSQVRERLGLQPQSEKGGVNERLHAADAKAFRVFVQSTSVNRKLIAGTTFLYEISDMEDTGTVILDADKESVLPSVPDSVAKEMMAEADKKEKTKNKEKKAKKKTEKAKKEEKESVEKTEESATEPVGEVTEPVDADETLEKGYTDSVDFKELPSTAEVVSVDSEEFTDILKGKSLEEIIEAEETEDVTEEACTEEKESPEVDKDTKEKDSESESSTDEEMEKFINFMLLNGPCKIFETEAEMNEAQQLKKNVHEYVDKMFNIGTKEFGDKKVMYLEGDMEFLKRLSGLAKYMEHIV